MYQETSNAVMGILLVHDVRNKKGASFANVCISLIARIRDRDKDPIVCA